MTVRMDLLWWFVAAPAGLGGFLYGIDGLVHYGGLGLFLFVSWSTLMALVAELRRQLAVELERDAGGTVGPGGGVATDAGVAAMPVQEAAARPVLEEGVWVSWVTHPLTILVVLAVPLAVVFMLAIAR